MGRASHRGLCALALAALIAAAPPAVAKTLRWASIADHSSADPHGQNQIINNAINGQVYEGLVRKGKKMEIVPRLAERWEQVSPS